jgi:hypothetical protein
VFAAHILDRQQHILAIFPHAQRHEKRNRRGLLVEPRDHFLLTAVKALSIPTSLSKIGRFFTNVPNWLSRPASQNDDRPSWPQPGGVDGICGMGPSVIGSE